MLILPEFYHAYVSHYEEHRIIYFEYFRIGFYTCVLFKKFECNELYLQNIVVYPVPL